MEVTEQDKKNNPGVDEATIQYIKAQYHFHKLSSVTLHDHTLHCTFLVDTDPVSLFYTPLERGAEPVRDYDVSKVEGVEKEEKIKIMPDGLSVRVGDQYISSEEIWVAVPQPEK